MILKVDRTWDGRTIPGPERAQLTLTREGEIVRIAVDAPFHGDPAPPGPPGTTDGLWEYEVAELFLLGQEQRYLEVELGPHGHHLVLELVGRRNVVTRHLPLTYTSRIAGDRWNGEARLDARLLPRQVSRGNAYLIHGVGDRRRYLAAYPVLGDEPDFHRLEQFGKLDL